MFRFIALIKKQNHDSFETIGQNVSSHFAIFVGVLKI